MTDRHPDHGISLAEASRTWARIAALSFGGPAGQIAVMHRILVDEKRWISDARFLHALNYCMLLPGPEAQQLATYIGWLMHRTKGGLIAGALFVLPGFIAIMALSWLYALFGNVGAVAALFFGLKAAVLAIVLDAVRRIGARTLKNATLKALAATAFVAIFFFGAPFPVIVIAAGLIGWLASRGVPTPSLRPGTDRRVRPRMKRRPCSAKRFRNMRGPISGARSACLRSCCCSGSRRSSCSWLCSGRRTCSAGSACSSRKWR